MIEVVDSLVFVEDGHVYRLLPSVDEVTFGVDSGNNYTPPYIDIYCGYVEHIGDGVKSFPGNVKANLGTSAFNGGAAPYNIVYRLLTGSTPWQEGWKLDISVTNGSPSGYGVGIGTLRIQSSWSYTAIEYALTTSDSISQVSDANIIDRRTIPIVKSGKKGGDGKPGGDGKNAVIYTLECVPSQLKTNAARTETHTAAVKAYKTDGVSPRVQFTTGTIEATAYDLSGNTIGSNVTGNNQVTVSTFHNSQSNTLSVLKWEVSLKIGTKVVANLTVPIITNGPTIRGPRIWQELDDFSYESGAEGEAFIDLAIYDGKIHQCIQSYTETGTSRNPASSPAYWKEATQFNFVATYLLLAERAKIVNLVVEELEARKLHETVNNTQKGWYSNISGGEFEIDTYEETATSLMKQPRYLLAADADGNPVIKFYGKDGKLKGQIDENLFANVATVGDTYDLMYLIGSSGLTPFSSLPTDNDFSTYENSRGIVCYKYLEGYTKTGNDTYTYTLGKRTGISSYDRAQNNGTNGSWVSQMLKKNNEASFKTGALCLATGYYIKAGVYKEFKTENGLRYERKALDIYRCYNETVGNYTYSGRLVKSGSIYSGWILSGIQPYDPS